MEVFELNLKTCVTCGVVETEKCEVSINKNSHSCGPGATEPGPLVRLWVGEAFFGQQQWKRGLGTRSRVLIPVFPERLDGADPVIDGDILMTVTCYVKKPSDPKIRAGFSGRSLFALVQESISPPTTESHAAVERSYGSVGGGGGPTTRSLVV